MSLLTVGSVAFDKLETPFGKTFKVNYRLFSEQEVENLEDLKFNE